MSSPLDRIKNLRVRIEGGMKKLDTELGIEHKLRKESQYRRLVDERLREVGKKVNPTDRLQDLVAGIYKKEHKTSVDEAKVIISDSINRLDHLITYGVLTGKEKIELTLLKDKLKELIRK